MRESRIPSLDGLRAISIALVLLEHFVPTLHLTWLPQPEVFNLGGLGVRVFFVISGFLITRLLLEEQARHGGISLGRFYFRRTMRIFPPYYAFLLAMFIMDRFGARAVSSEALVHAATYTTNYFNSPWDLGHSWSLSVEEQFYLIWPAVMILLGPRRWMAGAALILLVSPVSRVIWPSSAYRLDVVADSLAVGCLLAGLRERLIAARPWPVLMRSGWTFVGALVVSIGVELLKTHPSVVPTWLTGLAMITLQNVLIGLALHWAVLNHESGIGRMLNSRPFVFVGVMSYSIYVWQQPFLNHNIISPLTTFPLNAIAAFACAIGSYYLIEQPSLAFRKKIDAKFSRPKKSAPIAARLITE